MAARKGRAKASTDEAKRKAREKARAYRERMRAKGLRPVQLWVTDTRSPEFAAEAHRQSRAVAESPYAADDQAFVDAASEDIFR
jgi:hypothetical protein